MDKQSELVTAQMEKGTYFTEALSWYNSRFVFVHSQFSQLVIICAISVTAFLLCLFGLYSFLPVTEKRLYVVFQPVTTDYTLSVKKLMDKPGDDPDYALATHLTEEYVAARESYVLEKSERNFNFVYAMSDGAALDEYINYVSPSNLQSPYVVYANRGRRNVLVNWVKFYNKEGKEIKKALPEGTAKISFTAQENFGHSSSTPQNYVAQLSYIYINIGIDQETERLTQKPKMLITEYTTKTDSGSN